MLAGFAALVPAALATRAPAHHNDAWARQHFAAAERMREALNGRPLAARARVQARPSLQASLPSPSVRTAAARSASPRLIADSSA